MQDLLSIIQGTGLTINDDVYHSSGVFWLARPLPGDHRINLMAQ